MFRKLVSNLSFSPALVGQLSFYARRLRKEESARKAGLILTALALVVQSFAVFIPPESANAASPNDFVSGGISSLDEYIQLYDGNSRSLKDIFDAAGITRSEIASTSAASYEPANTIVYGRSAQVSDDSSTPQVLGFEKADGSIGMVYGSVDTSSSSAPSHKGWAGYSDAVGWFAIAKSNGNLVTEKYIESEFSLPTVRYSKSARNLTQSNENAAGNLVHGGDRVQYRLTIENIGDEVIEAPVVDRLGDVLEYAQLVDTGGGSFDSNEKTLSWNNVTLQPGESKERAFLVQLFDPIPATPRGVTDSSSYDCVMTNTFGNTVNLSVVCPTPKAIESTISQLPTAGTTANIVFSAILLCVTLYFYARSLQLQKEIRIIRRDLNAGII